MFTMMALSYVPCRLWLVVHKFPFSHCSLLYTPDVFCSSSRTKIMPQVLSSQELIVCHPSFQHPNQKLSTL